jgi:DNA repair protein SbcC/Rad50
VIPLRVALKGFLCYRDEQEFRFDGAPLWLLSGFNGSGKSAVFDALTYALFGQHRDGQQNALELIHKDRDGLVVEFDFALDGRRYRARRTLRRTRSGSPSVTQQVREFVSSGDGPGRWEDVPDTTRKGDFDEWVRQHVGLSYKTFTSSVLLMQGRSERLIEAGAAERFQVLSAVVDLQRYERLHDRAKARSQQLQAEAEGLQRRLADLPSVSVEEIEQAVREVAEALRRLDEARGEVDRLQALEAQADRWARIEAELAEVRRWWDQAEALWADAQAIARDADRLAELQEVVPHLVAAAEQRDLLAQSAAASESLDAELRALRAELSRRDEERERARRDWDALKAAIADDERRERAVSARLRELSALLARVVVCEKARSKLALLEDDLSRLPPDLPDRHARLEAESDRLAALSRSLGPLTRLREARAELRQARERWKAATAAGRAAGERAEPLRAELARLSERCDLEAEQAKKAEALATEHRVHRAEAIRALGEVDKLSGPSCQACGQPLTPEHVESERARREAAVAEAEAQYRRARQDADEAARRDRDARARRDEVDRHLALEARAVEQAAADVAQAETEGRRVARECDRILDELDDQVRARFATEGPDEAALDDARRDARQAEEVARRLREVERDLDRRNLLREQLASARLDLEMQERDLPADPAGLRAEDAALSAEEAALTARLASHRQRETAMPGEFDRLRDARERAQKSLTDLEQRMAIEEARREGYRSYLERSRAALPERWRPLADAASADDLRALREERGALQSRGVEARAQALRQAWASRDLQRTRLEDLEARRAEIPPEARRDPAGLRDELAVARTTRDRLADEWLGARHREGQVRARSAERERLDRLFRDADKARSTAATLAKLLGRDRLQRHLVRRAERRIVDISNGILDRLSGGELRLDLRPEDPGGGSADQALDLVAYNRATARAPIGVAFLSGSQRFRVAVSLALGVGQYAGRRSRPIESVIIDEGFGCLDRQGRQVMIQELQNLRSQLRCILLVSHQEEFADAFADGYRLELREGTTVATRFRR